MIVGPFSSLEMSAKTRPSYIAADPGAWVKAPPWGKTMTGSPAPDVDPGANGTLMLRFKHSVDDVDGGVATHGLFGGTGIGQKSRGGCGQYGL